MDYPVDDRDKSNVQRFHDARQVDPCALFDLAAVRKVVGERLDQVRPTSLNRCVLRTGQSRDEPEWWLEVVVGEVVPDSPTEQIDGILVSKRERDTRCGYGTPTSGAYGVWLEAEWHGRGGVQAPKPACSVVREYLTATIARWAPRPPQRSEGRTEPALPLGLVDPCIAAKTLLNGKGAVRVTDPYSCSIPTGDPIGIQIQYRFDNDPVTYLQRYPTLVKSTELIGKPAFVQARKNDCQVNTQYSRDTEIKVESAGASGATANQVIMVTAKTCDMAITAAQAVVDRIGENPPKIGLRAPGAVKLGDLNPP